MTGTKRLADRSREEPIRVLHVDDDPAFLEVAAELVERADERIRVRTVTDPTEALSLFADEEFDCVVSDYDMPDRNGIELYRVVRDTGAGTPFVLFTGTDSEGVADEALSAGVTAFVEKGVGTEQYARLADRIVAAVEHANSDAGGALVDPSGTD